MSYYVLISAFSKNIYMTADVVNYDFVHEFNVEDNKLFTVNKDIYKFLLQFNANVEYLKHEWIRLKV